VAYFCVMSFCCHSFLLRSNSSNDLCVVTGYNDHTIHLLLQTLCNQANEKLW